jgi:hypothetical protein
MSTAPKVVTRTGIQRLALGCAVVIATLALTAASSLATTVAFTTAPTLPTLTGVTLNGQSQSTLTIWGNAMQITSSGTNSGWNVTVNSRTGAGRSAVFKQYCPNTTCGSDSGPGYITGGFTLPSDSLTMNTSGAGWTTSGTKPAYQCNSSPFCNIDQTTATKVVSASSGVALGTWTGSGSTILTLATPASLRKLQPSEVYRVDVLWTLSSGP